MDPKYYNIHTEYLLYLKWWWIYTHSKDEERKINDIIPYFSWDSYQDWYTSIWVDKFYNMMVKWYFFKIKKIWTNYLWYTIEDYIILHKKM